MTTQIEHPAVLQTMAALEQDGFEVTYLVPDGWGHISPDAIRAAVRPDTILVSLMAVNNEVGTRLPLDAARAAISEAGAPALLHVDAVQAFGKIPLAPGRMGIDLLTVSGHKIDGPKGVGALFVKKGTRPRRRTCSSAAGRSAACAPARRACRSSRALRPPCARCRISRRRKRVCAP